MKIVRKYAPGLKIWNGESGATSDPHFSAGISSMKRHSELTQAKWNARRYPQVKNWACWNEPNNIDANTPEIVVDNNIRTARIIKKYIPDAKIGMLTLGTRNMNAFTEACLKLFTRIPTPAIRSGWTSG